MVGLRFNPDVSQNETFSILSNTGNTIAVVSPNENGASFETVAGAGKTYAGYYEFNNMFFGRGGNLVIADLLTVTNTMDISEYGMLTHYPTTTTFTSGLDLTVRILNIDATGRINADGRGYLGGTGWHEQGRTKGNIYGSSDGAGGSYGGLGGGYQGRPTNPVYGSATDPMDLGSGGGAWDNEDGGNGGGLIFINAGQINMNGIISANGYNSAGSAAGDGSGGSINIYTGNLMGSGFIWANGGGRGSGAGGGRIAIHHSGVMTLPPANVSSNGGHGGYATGGDGTVHIE